MFILHLIGDSCKLTLTPNTYSCFSMCYILSRLIANTPFFDIINLASSRLVNTTMEHSQHHLSTIHRATAVAAKGGLGRLVLKPAVRSI